MDGCRINNITCSWPVGDWQCYIGESVAFSWAVKSGCQMSIIRTSRRELPSCQTSCSNESSNIINFPSLHSRVSLATLIRGPGGTTRPRCARIRQLVGPVCGQTCATGCITENLIYKQPQWSTTIGYITDRAATGTRVINYPGNFLLPG